MRLLTALAAALCAFVLAAGEAAAQDETKFLRNTMLQSGDYDSFRVDTGGRAAIFACAQACEKDARCQAWTFISTVQQCRLKREVGPQVTNSCCVSGLKLAKTQSSDSKQAFCSDYANDAVDASDRNIQQGCRQTGPRWASDFSVHYSWCMRSPRQQADDETAARADALQNCKVASTGPDKKAFCDHYARVSVAQSVTNEKANCRIRQSGGLLWSTDRTVFQDQCGRASRDVRIDVATRENLLDSCFDTAGAEEAACKTYAEGAVRQFQDSLDEKCDFQDTALWSSSKLRHYQFCLDSSEKERQDAVSEREDQLNECQRQAALRKQCDDYAEVAVGQARLNERLKCGLRGVRWSKYADDHFDFCMRASNRDRDAEQASRDGDLQVCQRKKTQVDAECDIYARKAVRAVQLNGEQRCGNVGREVWNADYKYNYNFCIQSNSEDRLQAQIQRRRALRVCSFLKGFTLEIEF